MLFFPVLCGEVLRRGTRRGGRRCAHAGPRPGQADTKGKEHANELRARLGRLGRLAHAPRSSFVGPFSVVQEALLAQARMAAEVQKAALRELAELELAKAEAAVKEAEELCSGSCDAASCLLSLSRSRSLSSAEAAPAPATVANGERKEQTQKEDQEDQEANKEEGAPGLEAQASEEKKRSDRSPAQGRRDEGCGSDFYRLWTLTRLYADTLSLSSGGARSQQRPRSRSRSRSRHRRAPNNG